jgi:hypothetical protein
VPRYRQHRSAKAVSTITTQLKIARQRLTKGDLSSFYLSWLCTSPTLRLQKIEEFAQALEMQEGQRNRAMRRLQEPTRKFQKAGWFRPQGTEAERSEKIELLWTIVPGNDNAVCLALAFSYFEQLCKLKHLSSVDKQDLEDRFKEAYFAAEPGCTVDTNSRISSNVNGAPRVDEKQVRIRRLMKAASIRYLWEPELSWPEIGKRYFDGAAGSSLRRDVMRLGELVYGEIASNWTIGFPGDRKKEIAREWDLPDWNWEKALDDHLGFDSNRHWLRERFSFPQHHVPSPGQPFHLWQERNEQIICYLAKTLFHIGRTGKLTLPESCRPQRPS